MGDSKRPRCEKCDSTQCYVRKTINQRVCTTCGHIENLTDEEVKVNG